MRILVPVKAYVLSVAFIFTVAVCNAWIGVTGDSLAEHLIGFGLAGIMIWLASIYEIDRSHEEVA